MKNKGLDIFAIFMTGLFFGTLIYTDLMWNKITSILMILVNLYYLLNRYFKDK